MRPIYKKPGNIAVPLGEKSDSHRNKPVGWAAVSVVWGEFLFGVQNRSRTLRNPSEQMGYSPCDLV